MIFWSTKFVYSRSIAFLMFKWPEGSLDLLTIFPFLHYETAQFWETLKKLTLNSFGPFTSAPEVTVWSKERKLSGLDYHTCIWCTLSCGSLCYVSHSQEMISWLFYPYSLKCTRYMVWAWYLQNEQPSQCWHQVQLNYVGIGTMTRIEGSFRLPLLQ
jgi:hypothetical protein